MHYYRKAAGVGNPGRLLVLMVQRCAGNASYIIVIDYARVVPELLDETNGLLRTDILETKS